MESSDGSRDRKARRRSEPWIRACRVRGEKTSEMEPQERNGSCVCLTTAQETGSSKGARLWSPGQVGIPAESNVYKDRRARGPERGTAL